VNRQYLFDCLYFDDQASIHKEIQLERFIEYQTFVLNRHHDLSFSRDAAQF